MAKTLSDNRDVLVKLYTAKLNEQMYRASPFLIDRPPVKRSLVQRVRDWFSYMRARVGFWIAGYEPSDD
jgi:hypothetical protein